MWSDLTTHEMQTTFYFQASLQLFAWEFQQSRRGLLTTEEVDVMKVPIRSWHTDSRTFPSYWEARKHQYPNEFVEWVEELRP